MRKCFMLALSALGEGFSRRFYSIKLVRPPTLPENLPTPIIPARLSRAPFERDARPLTNLTIFNNVQTTGGRVVWSYRDSFPNRPAPQYHSGCKMRTSEGGRYTTQEATAWAAGWLERPAVHWGIGNGKRRAGPVNSVGTGARPALPLARRGRSA